MDSGLGWSCPTQVVLECRQYSSQSPATSVVSLSAKVRTCVCVCVCVRVRVRVRARACTREYQIARNLYCPRNNFVYKGACTYVQAQKFFAQFAQVSGYTVHVLFGNIFFSSLFTNCRTHAHTLTRRRHHKADPGPVWGPRGAAQRNSAQPGREAVQHPGEYSGDPDGTAAHQREV